MSYNIFKSSNTLTPFTVVNENTINSTACSLYLIGKKKDNYGQPQDQNFFWLLENFANATPPLNAIKGQGWFNTIDNKMYVCTDDILQTFEKVGNPIVSASAPSLSLGVGNLWYDSVDKKVFAWDGAAWNLVGPSSTVPATVQQEDYLNVITTNATTQEMWLGGVTNARLAIPANNTWAVEIVITARRTNGTGEQASWILKGTIDNTSNAVTLVGGISKEVLSKAAPDAAWDATFIADNVNKALVVQVTGEAGKTIKWNAVVKAVKVTP